MDGIRLDTISDRSTSESHLIGWAARACAAAIFVAITLAAVPTSATASGPDPYVRVLAQKLTYWNFGDYKNNVTVTQSGDTYTIRDDGNINAIEIRSQECDYPNPFDRKTVACNVKPVRVEIYMLGPENETDGTDRAQMIGTRDSVLEGGSGSDTLLGGAGDDLLYGGLQADTIEGGPGSDTSDYNGSPPDGMTFDLIAGTASDGDTLRDVENIVGTERGDTFIGNGADNSFFGKGGNDVMDGGLGADKFRGGSDTDYVDYSKRIGLGIVVDQNIPGGDGYAGENDDVSSDVEVILGGPEDDQLTAYRPAQGEPAGYVLVGNDGADTLTGGDDADWLVGGDGNDTLDGGLGADLLSGGADLDTVSYANRASTIIVDQNEAGNDGAPGENDSVPADVEVIIGGTNLNYLVAHRTAGDPLRALIGPGRYNWLIGGDGSDWLLGQSGNDYIVGNKGSDLLVGNAGPDTVYAAGDPNGPPDMISCGPDADVWNADPVDLFIAGHGCE